MPAFIKPLTMETTHTAIIVLSALNVLLMLLVQRFDKYVYMPFLQRTGMEPAKQAEFNPHLLGLGICVAGGGLLCYAAIGWLWLGFL